MPLNDEFDDLNDYPKEHEILIEFIDEKVKEFWDIPPKFNLTKDNNIATCWKDLTEKELRSTLESGLPTLDHEELQAVVRALLRSPVPNLTEEILTKLRNVSYQNLSPQEVNIPKIVDNIMTQVKVFREIGYDDVIISLVLFPLEIIYKTRYRNDLEFLAYYIRRLPPLERKEEELTELDVLLEDYVNNKIRNHWKVSPEYYDFWLRLSPEDYRTNLESGIQNTCDSDDLKILVIMLNFKLDEGKREITTIVDKIMEMDRSNEKSIRNSVRGNLRYIYKEKFRHDAEFKTLANEKLRWIPENFFRRKQFSW